MGISKKMVVEYSIEYTFISCTYYLYLCIYIDCLTSALTLSTSMEFPLAETLDFATHFQSKINKTSNNQCYMLVVLCRYSEIFGLQLNKN